MNKSDEIKEILSGNFDMTDLDKCIRLLNGIRTELIGLNPDSKKKIFLDDFNASDLPVANALSLMRFKVTEGRVVLAITSNREEIKAHLAYKGDDYISFRLGYEYDDGNSKKKQ